METITMEQDAMAQAKDLQDISSVSHDDLKKLFDDNPAYPGWGIDFDNAFDSYEARERDRFKARELKKKRRLLDDFKSLFKARELKKKQRLIDDFKSFNRLKALVALVLTYPDSEQDIQSAEEWHIKNVSNEENDRIFQDKLDGLKNKERLYFGDRTHACIVAIDKLKTTYPGWEEDYRCAVLAHCEAPSARFPDAFHALREKQQVFLGDRSQWRLVQLDNIKLSYPGWEEDVKEVEEWHLQNAVNDENNGMFNEVLEGMKDQQMIYMGWDHDPADAPSIDSCISNLDNTSTLSESASSYSSKSTGSSSAASSYTLTKNPDPVDEIKEACYKYISKSLKTHKQQKKQLMEERSQSRPTSGPEARNTPSSVFNKSWFAPRPAPRQGHDSNDNEDSDKRANLGKCVVCLNRTKTHVFVPCGHLCACAPCSSKAMKTTGACPICRGKADHNFRVFMT
jgi:hypothetical protein